eukprot:TRINITY_DN1092_c0_g1_i1.p1 TRINITY_DN1092_c0_g1~~TRINITY_DN1092_c0_g1_i1.p1  ORF type:complete len:196 (+),score=26.29 TRINITY_DN1092_c0_g1_i1:33-590(+)
MELFTVPEFPIVILQQRAPTVRRAAAAYSKAISTWVKECGFSSVIVLASTEASRRRDFQLAGDQFRHFTTGSDGASWRDSVKEIGMKVLERVDGSVPEDSADVDTRDLQCKKAYMPTSFLSLSPSISLSLSLSLSLSPWHCPSHTTCTSSLHHRRSATSCWYNTNTLPCLQRNWGYFSIRYAFLF